MSWILGAMFGVTVGWFIFGLFAVLDGDDDLDTELARSQFQAGYPIEREGATQ